MNLSYLPRLKQLAGTLVGDSGHERGIAIPVAAVALGAKLIEKHFTVDRGMEGNDHKVSLLSEEFAEMVRQIRAVEEAMGQGGERALSQGELINRENLAKSLVITQALPKGAPIRRELIAIKSPGQGLQPNRIDELVGRLVQRDFQPGDLFFESDLSQASARPSRYRFSRPYGIPVRYHEDQRLTEGLELDFVEFHLSYHDLEVTLAEALPSAPQPIGFAVHSPELFAGDHILDLASADAAYRRHSIDELRRVVAIAAELRQSFPKTQRPVLVLNAGGWTPHGFLPVAERAALYDRVAESLAEIDLSPVELGIQTMPPFPWHFGGQSHHNLFVDPEEIRAFCDRTGHKICLDISHSMMEIRVQDTEYPALIRSSPADRLAAVLVTV
ncbi:N-acetylneuraminate synthase family protein [Lamprobacter modestohalophilus]|uniref:N-acetylneuraminate synthase family protein n=1 Tax=Lamprobacter modestohalophilus TaxID=1064514 RepID=UPI002ADEC61A|nr:N-acetylneuraminate synthase family protein [Lamprobacter modestohalophilus]MEA1051580.1 N-acetylneuraminate synthase family protein [Lamprobacter modestohalophilus]